MINPFLSGFFEKYASIVRKRVESILYNKDGKVLVNKYPDGNVRFPGGGVDKGESLTEAGNRETKEEAGYNSLDLKKLEVPSFMFTSREKERHGEKGDKERTSFVFGKLNKKDRSIYNVDGDAMPTKFMDLDKLIAQFKSQATGTWLYSNKARIKALKKVKAKI